jgi:hypothetical protein
MFTPSWHGAKMKIGGDKWFLHRQGDACFKFKFRDTGRIEFAGNATE